jgi:glycosyltransferase involved in cell wall biosynthesis
LAKNGARFAVDRDFTINEALYRSASGEEACADLLERTRPELVIVDMLRCAQFVEGVSVPKILDLDDLLSRRYADVVGGAVTADVMLGYYGERVPFLPLVGRFLQPFLSALLRVESARLARKEIAATRKFGAVTLVSSREAESLRRDAGAGVAIEAIPMGMDMPSRVASIAGAPSRLVFVGSPRYWPNKQALTYADRVLLPEAEKALGSRVELTVVGTADEKERRAFGDRLRFAGYVDDLDSVLLEHDVFVAPIVSGSGIKTKVVEAMSRGLVVVGTPRAFDGLAVSHQEHALVFETPEEFAANLAFLREHAVDARRIAANGRRYVADTFAFDVIAGLWQRTIASVQRPHPERAGSNTIQRGDAHPAGE